MDPAELELPYEQPMHFEGLEGELPVEVDPKGLRRRYREAMPTQVVYRRVLRLHGCWPRRVRLYRIFVGLSLAWC